MPPELRLLLPEAILAAGIVAMLLVDLAGRRSTVVWVGLLAVAAAIAAATSAHAGSLGAMLRLDGAALLARPAILAATGLVLVAGRALPSLVRESDSGQFHILIVALGLGALLTAASSHLVMLWLALELVSLASYPLVCWRGRGRSAAEAGMKYVLYGGLASAVTLFGMSHVYGITGSLDFRGIGAALTEGSPAAIAALCLASAGLLYKLALVPMHLYAPDVYQGAPSLTVAAIGTIPKIAAIAILARALDLAVPAGLASPIAIGGIIAVLAVATMLWAAFTALGARDAKRILAFSAIAHAGIIVLALACRPSPGALPAAAFYLAAYTVANLGAFFCLAVLEEDCGGSSLEAITGAMRRRPGITAAFTLFVVSLIGVPPLAGFLAKWHVLAEILRSGLGEAGRGYLVWAALAVLLTSAVSAWAYLQILRAAILNPSEAPAATTRIPAPLAAAIIVCAIATVALGLGLGLTERIALLLR